MTRACYTETRGEYGIYWGGVLGVDVVRIVVQGWEARKRKNNGTLDGQGTRLQGGRYTVNVHVTGSVGAGPGADWRCLQATLRTHRRQPKKAAAQTGVGGLVDARNAPSAPGPSPHRQPDDDAFVGGEGQSTKVPQWWNANQHPRSRTWSAISPLLVVVRPLLGTAFRHSLSLFFFSLF